ncbi:MAG TPA: SUMF1/EgtB/PvdO family nonheme iron enzyme, partial [Leptospiraceae bacterium]|nr:SUMF1/EgtB/PvdO family nonheme iron enzyme [Leptospiraceae bacterium]
METFLRIVLGILFLPLVSCQQTPAGMAKLPSGTYFRGLQISRKADQRPRHKVRIRSFYLDETLVTVADFRRFVERTGYQTSAERMGYAMI